MKQLLWAMVCLAFLNACHSAATKTLPIYGERQTVTKTVDGKSVVDTIYQTIPAFKFVNQYNDTITNKNLDGKIYVADFFFTSCPSICPIMQRNMLLVYNEFKNDPNVKILSHTIDPKHDTVPVLKDYADKLGISGNSWWLLLGQKEVVYQLAEKHYLVSVNEGKGGFIHQGWFVLVDKQKRIRGSYDGTVPDQVKQLVADMHTLQQEK
ncbi:SCO family protein [Mucilaginibacter paludis]|uniref:Electron transport protein SCO1/SenC n=1 Tax=Mucilaginibacter paludis DSM 18603 TaxID=714943 RepID=H1Y3D2_9SPHI|nr:SCO family protein [Mucilaginibacter paludis]EHQ29287.1 electron transport protein SCO1/SenC [Mucilaginibacter paludis DSM 18603]